MRAIHDPTNLRTTDQMIKIYHTSRQTLRRRREKAVGTPYEHAFLRDGRKILYDIKMWQAFIEYLDKQNFEKKYGIKDLRNSKQFA